MILNYFNNKNKLLYGGGDYNLIIIGIVIFFIIVCIIIMIYNYSQPVETKPVETKTVETKPVETKTVETKPVETKPVETKPVETKPVETKPEEVKPEEVKPSTTQQYIDVECKFISSDSDFTSSSNILSNLTWKGACCDKGSCDCGGRTIIKCGKANNGGYYKTTQYDYYLKNKSKLDSSDGNVRLSFTQGYPEYSNSPIMLINGESAVLPPKQQPATLPSGLRPPTTIFKPVQPIKGIIPKPSGFFK